MPSKTRNSARRSGQTTRSTLAGVILGIAVGIGFGMFYGWQVNPVVSTDVSPWQLNAAGQTNWLIAVSVAWGHDNDLLRAANRLNDLHWGSNTFQRIADTACELARSSYAQSQVGLIAIRSIANLAAGQGKTGCASALVPLTTPSLAPSPTVITATPSLVPPASKTPTPPPGPTFTPATQPPAVSTASAGAFQLVRTEPYCSAKASGVIEVLVQEADSTGVPGVAIRADSSSGADQFFTGLEPEHDPGYADFKMKPSETYTIALVGGTDRSEPLKAAACTDRTNSAASAVTSYRVYFRRAAH